VEFLQGDASKARQHLGWEANVRFRGLVELMVDSDIKLLNDKLNGQFERQLAGQFSEYPI
jgi:GDPmannose 4,6-dehydratase